MKKERRISGRLLLQSILACILLLVSIAASSAEKLRYEGFTDKEIEEIKSAFSEVYSSPINMISGATERCNCEEGPDCSSQVTVSAQEPGSNHSLELSRIGGRWVVGKLQKWQLEYKAFQTQYYSAAKKEKALSFYGYAKSHADAFRALMAAKPICPANPP